MRRFGLVVVAMLAVLAPLGGAALAQGCEPSKVAVTFRYVPLPGEEVTSVSLRGSFNDWGEWPMEKQPDGTWSITVCLAPGEYQYKYFINGQWPKDMERGRDGGPVDPDADGYVDDGFGGQNAVKVVTMPATSFYVRHDPSDPAFLCRADGRLVIRVQVAPGFVDNLALVTERWTIPLSRQLEWDYGEVWRGAVSRDEPFSYWFEGRLSDGKRFRLPETPGESFTTTAMTSFPQLEWVSGGVGYQIFPDRFRNGDPGNDTLALETDERQFNQLAQDWEPILSAWNDPITPLHCCHQYFGGDIAGVLEKLDYLESLGVILIYLNPIFDSGSAHGYDTHDYLRVAPRLGSEEELAQLLEEAHRRGIKVIFDFVPNHTGLGFWAFQDVVRNGPHSEYWDWYFIKRWPFSPGDGSAYEGWWGLGSLPKLNTGNPEVKRYLFDVALHWLDFGFDGLRVDVPNELVAAHEFFRELRALVKSSHPDAYLVGEIWALAPEWLKGDQFDSLMNYALGRDILLRYAQGRMSGEEALRALARFYAAYGENVAGMGFNVVSTHDTSRMLSDLNGGRLGDEPTPEALKRLKLLTTLLFTQPGIPVIFQGEERGCLGEKGNHDAQRYPIQWDRCNQEVLAHFHYLAQLRREVPALSTSTLWTYAARDGVLAYFRGQQREVLVVANNSPRLVVFPLPSGRWRVFESGAELTGSTVVPPLHAWVLLREGD